MNQTEISVIDLAKELKRLANGLLREAQRESDLACLSNLAAIKPLTQILFETISSEVVIAKPEASETETRNPIGFCATSSNTEK
jgi:hypothetical protein